MTAPVNSLGGSMYGDGEYVVDFENAESNWAPMRALVFSPSGKFWTVDLADDAKKGVKLAAAIIALVRAQDR